MRAFSRNGVLAPSSVPFRLSSVPFLSVFIPFCLRDRVSEVSVKACYSCTIKNHLHVNRTSLACEDLVTRVDLLPLPLSCTVHVYLQLPRLSCRSTPSPPPSTEIHTMYLGKGERGGRNLDDHRQFVRMTSRTWTWRMMRKEGGQDTTKRSTTQRRSYLRILLMKRHHPSETSQEEGADRRLRCVCVCVRACVRVYCESLL